MSHSGSSVGAAAVFSADEKQKLKDWATSEEDQELSGLLYKALLLSGSNEELLALNKKYAREKRAVSASGSLAATPRSPRPTTSSGVQTDVVIERERGDVGGRPPTPRLPTPRLPTPRQPTPRLPSFSNKTTSVLPDSTTSSVQSSNLTPRPVQQQEGGSLSFKATSREVEFRTKSVRGPTEAGSASGSSRENPHTRSRSPQSEGFARANQMPPAHGQGGGRSGLLANVDDEVLLYTVVGLSTAVVVLLATTLRR